MERLGRGVVALHSATSQAYISWRLLANDPTDIGFNIYRVTAGIPTKLNSTPIVSTTDFLDTGATFSVSNYWYVTTTNLITHVEGPPSGAAGLAANATVKQYLSVPLQPVIGGMSPPYDAKFCWIGDFDGDGEYDYLVDRLTTTATNKANQYLQCYLRDGTFLWQMDMGFNSTNISNAYEPDAAAICVGDKDNVTVYDLDGDGKAEIIVRTANGTTCSNAAGVQMFSVTTNNNTAQFLSIIDGMTGAEKARAVIPNPYFADGPLNCHAGIFYADGVHPSILFSGENRVGSGAFQRLAVAWDYRDGKLTQRWLYQTPSGQNDSEGHQLRIADANHDGKDDVIRIGGVISDSNGVPVTLYSTECAHGDRYHVTDIDPDRPGLEMYSIQQLNPSLLATELQDLGSGVLFKKWYSSVITDVGRGDVLDMDPRYRGMEVFSTQPGVFDSKGNQISATGTFPTLGLWWDADNQREMLSAADGNGFNPVINKWNYSSSSAGRVYSVYNDGAHTAYGGRPAMIGDIFGDWREEFICMANTYTELRIFTTKIVATNRLYCLMQNPEYRVQCTYKGYYQSSYTDYYLGEQMQPPQPSPQVDSLLVWRGGAGNVWNASAANWRTNWTVAGNANTNPAPYADTSTVLFDLTGSNNTAIALTGTLTPGDVTVYSPKDYTFDNSAGSLSGTMKLTKAGAGKLMLTGTNDFTGATTVWEGPLVVNGRLSASPVTVRGGVWLDGAIGGSGLVSQGATIYRGGNVSPGAGTNSPATLAIANGLSLVDGAFCRFDLSDDPTGTIKTNDLLNISGNFTVTGTNHIVITRLNSSLPAGAVYPLINYSGSLVGGTLASFDVSGLPGIPVVLTNPPGQIALVVKSYRAPANITWTGGSGGNVWDLLTTTNWLNGGSPDQFAPNDTVRFDNTGGANLNVTLVGDLNCSNIVVDSTANYSIGGSGGIIGAAGLSKSNSGTLTITALNNTFTGKTSLGGGTLSVAELDAVGYPSPLGNPPGGSGNLVLSGSPTLRVTGESYTDRGMTLNAGTNSIEVFNAADQVTVAGVIAGSGALQKLGPGTLALNVNNTYTGQTYIRAGNVSLGGGTANQYGLGVGPGGNGNTTVTLDNGTLTMFSDTGSYDTCYWNLIVPSNSTGTIYADDRCNLYGSLTGSGTLNFNVYYVRTELDGNWSAFTGQLNLGTDSGGGDFRIGNGNGYGNASVNLADRIYAYHVTANAAVAFGSLTGGALSTLSGTAWTIGAKNLDSTYAGSILGNSFTKVGTGTLTLTGNTNTYTGTTTINGGTLQIGSGGAAGTIGTGNITDNATLAFNRSDALTDTGIGIISGNGNLAKRGGGSLTLSKAHTFSGATTIEVGTLALTGSGLVANSSNIVVNAGTFFDVTGLTAGTMTLGSDKTISGRGTVNGNFIVGSGGKVSPGTNSIGTLTFNGDLTLNAGSTAAMEINQTTGTKDLATVGGTLTYGGTLQVANLAGTFAAGNSYKIFGAAAYAGSFSSYNLPSLNSNLAWNVYTLNSNGTLSVVSAPHPQITGFQVNGGSLTFSGTGGIAGMPYYVLSSPDLTVPLASWTVQATNNFDANGNFTYTDASGMAATQRFYRLMVQLIQ